MNPPRRRLSPWRIALLAILAVIVLGAGAVGIFLARFDPNSLKPRIIEAVQRATGRDLTLNGKIGLKLSLRPTIEARDVAFANPPGFSRPQMATLERMQLQLALLPLLSRRIEIDSLVLIQPDILLETDTQGRPNWQLTPAAPATPQPQAPPRKASGGRTSVSVAEISIQDGKLAYRDDRGGKVMTLDLPKLQASAESPDAPLHVVADAAYNGTGFNLVADTGGLTRLQDVASTSPWPLKLTLTSSGAQVTADGTITQPLLGKGYTLSLSGAVPDLAALAPLLPRVALPALHDVSFAAKAVDQGGEIPALSALTLHVGASDLGAQLPTLFVHKLDVSAPTLDQPIKAVADARLGDAPLTLAATLGATDLLLPGGKAQPFPVDVTLQAAGAAFTAKGQIADPKAMTGADLAVTAQVPDLSALSPLARIALPPLKSIAFQGRVTEAAGGLRNGVALHEVGLSSPEADLAGDATLGLQPRKSLTATLTSSHIDLDALQAAFDQMPPQPGAQAPANPPAAQPAPRKREERLFSDQKLPFDLLREADANLQVTVGVLRSGGVDYKAITTHAALTEGKLSVDRLTADLPQGRLDAKLSADASQQAPPVRVSLRAPGLALKSVLAILRQPAFANGNLDVYADLEGAGASPHAIAASLGGSLGVAMAGGSIDNRMIGSVLGKVMDPLNALNLVGRGGNSEIRCFALRMDAQRGVGVIRAMTLSSSLVTMTGEGTINLGEETLGLTLRPEARVAGTPVVVPISVTGPIVSPGVGINKLGAAESNVGTVAGAVIGNATPLGVLGGLLGSQKLTGGGGDVCAPALVAARGGKLPEEGQTPGKPANPLANPEAALRNLFR